MAVWHVQGEPKTTWVVVHNLGRVPLVQIMSPDGEVIIGAVTRLSAATATIQFNEPTAGSVLLM